MAKVSFGNVTGFDWDEANINHIARHNVTPAEAEEIFFDSGYVSGEDLKHSQSEERFIIIGKTKESRLLYQIYTIREGLIRVISSRDLNKKEYSLYQKEV